MQRTELKRALKLAEEAARAAGALMRKNFRLRKKVNSEHQHDIKLELDVRCQNLIERALGAGFPNIAFLGEEGMAGAADAAYRWVVDPIDGTVNFTYEIPHACVSIALQGRVEDGAYETLAGVVYDPFCDELWTAMKGAPARLNGAIIQVSNRQRLDESVISLGFAKDRKSLERMLPAFNRLIYRVRKIRLMGAAALAMTYVASGRFDAYMESGIRLWDIAAGGLILECAGGEYWRQPISGEHRFEVVASNGLLRGKLERQMRKEGA